MKISISTTNAPAAIGPYSQAVEINGMVFVSGQLPIDPSTGLIISGNIKEQTAQVFRNIRNILSEAGLGMENILKTTVFLTDMANFADVNEIYAEQFSGVFPARSAFAVKSLPKEAPIEIEVIAVR